MKNIMVLSFIGILCFWFSTNCHSQEKAKTRNVIEEKGIKVDKNRGADTNIVKGIPVVDVPAPKPSPTQDTVVKQCAIDICNHSGYFVNLYVDGYFRGTIEPFECLHKRVNVGYYKLYGVSSGGTIVWGPRIIICTGSDETWSLNP